MCTAPPISGEWPLPNINEWYDAFDVHPGDKLYIKPEDRVSIW